MTYEELTALYGFEMPDYARDYYDSFIGAYDRSAPVLSREDADLVCSACSLPDEARSELIRSASAVDSDDGAHIAGSFLVHLCVYARLPWQNRIYSENLFTVPGLYPEQANWVIVARALAHTLRDKKPPEDLNAENTGSFRGYTKSCYNSRGYWGILEWNWNMLGAGGCMFMFGALKFVPDEFGGDFPVITDGSSFVGLVGGEYAVNAEGGLVSDGEPSVGRTVFTEDDEKYYGCPVTRDGKVSLTPVAYPKSVWHDFLREGTPVLSIHIPSKISYTPDVIRESCLKAIDFYRGFYPEFKPAAICGYSWIFAPQLARVLPTDSNILSVNRNLHILPTTASYGPDCRFIRQGSSLQQRVAAAVAEGTRFRYSLMFVPLDELDSLSDIRA